MNFLSPFLTTLPTLLFRLATITALSCSAFAPAFAEDTNVKKALDEATAAYSQRSATNPQPVDKALSLLGSIEGKAADSEANYDIYILEAKCLYWKGVHQSSNSDKMKVHNLGVEKAKFALKIENGFAEAYYYAGINLARWGKANGVVTSLFRKGELEEYMKQTLAHPTRNDQLGETLDGYGADRVLGKMYYELPSIFGGSHDKSISHLKKAYTQAKTLVLNGVYYAETLSSGNSAEKAEARRVLETLLKLDSKNFSPDRTPESEEELELAQKLLKEIS